MVEVIYERPDRSNNGSGIGGKLLCLLLGFIIGIVGAIGGIVGAGYYVYSQPVNKTLNLVDKSGAIYTTLFGDDDTVGILDEKYAALKIGDLLGDSIDTVKALSNGGSLSDLNDVSPKIGSLVEKLLETTDKYAIPFDKEIIMAKPLGELGGYLGDTVKEASLGDMLTAFGKGDEPLLKVLCYGEEGVDYKVDENGEIVMLGDAKKTTINDLMSAGTIDKLLNKVTLDSVMTLDPNDTILCTIAYGSSNRYTVVDGKVQMTQVTYTYEGNADSYTLYDDKAEPVSATIEALAAKTLKVTFEDGTVQYVSLNDDGVGKAYSDAEFLTPVNYKKTKIGDLTSDFMSIINNIYLKDALNIDASQHKVLISLAYGQENIDFHYVGEGANKTIEMLGTATPRTIGELRDRGGNLINDILLSDIIAVDPDEDLVMYLLYGKENIHYSVDANDNVIMLQKQIAMNGDVVYNEYGEKLSGYTLNTANSTYTAPDGTQYKYVASAGLTVNTEDDVAADVYYLTDLEGNAVYFSKTTIGDMAGNNSLIGSLTKRMTLKEILDEETINSNLFFKHIQDETIATLPNAINKLTLQQVYENEIFKQDADGNFLDKNGVITTNRDEYVVKGIWWYLLHDQNNCQTNHTGCDGTCVEDYNVTQLSKLVPNMQENVHYSTLNDLANNGLVQFNGSTLTSPIKTEVKITGLPTIYIYIKDRNGNKVKASEAFAGKTTMGELTIEEILQYVDGIINVFADLEK